MARARPSSASCTGRQSVSPSLQASSSSALPSAPWPGTSVYGDVCSPRRRNQGLDSNRAEIPESLPSGQAGVPSYAEVSEPDCATGLDPLRPQDLGAVWNRLCRVARRPDVPNLPAPASIAFPGRPEVSEEAKRTRFGGYYRISHRAILGDSENPSLKPLPDTTGMVSKIPRFSAIFEDGMRTLANGQGNAKIPLTIG
jgi:hypothetical protein